MGPWVPDSDAASDCLAFGLKRHPCLPKARPDCGWGHEVSCHARSQLVGAHVVHSKATKPSELRVIPSVSLNLLAG